MRSFTKFCKDAGLWIDKGNKFNTKPPNRVDYVFTYACTNGPEGRRGNKEMSAAQFTFALRGVAKETGWSLDEVEERAKNCSVQLNATEAISTRFHDDRSNYTGSHDRGGNDRRPASLSRENNCGYPCQSMQEG